MTSILTERVKIFKFNKILRTLCSFPRQHKAGDPPYTPLQMLSKAFASACLLCKTVVIMHFH